MITLHHLENSRSQRILWLLEELGVDYEIKHYRRDPKTSLAPPSLLKIHPLGKSPVITDGEITVAESGAIIEYLVGKYDDGRLLPAESTPERLAYTYWLHYAEGTIMPFLLLSLVLGKIETSPMPFFIKPIARGITGKVRQGFLNQNVKRNLDFMEANLEQNTWFCGAAMTAADIQMSFPIEAAAVRTNLARDYPHLKSWLERIHALPTYRAALEKGGPYELMGK